MWGLTGNVAGWSGWRRAAGAAALGIGMMAAGGAAAIDIGVSVRFASVDGDKRYDPLAVVDTLGRPDLFLCYRQGSDWACNPDKIKNRSLPVNAAALECRNSLRCVFRNLPLKTDMPFNFELRDADVTQNEIIESGTCRFQDTGLTCDTEIGNATLTLVSEQTNFNQQSTVQRQDNAWLALVAAMERDYRAAVPEESFAFCRDPEGAVQQYLSAINGMQAVKDLMNEPTNGWRVAHRLSQALMRGPGTPDASSSVDGLVSSFSSQSELMRKAISAIEQAKPTAQLTTGNAANQIFRQTCL